VIARPLRRLHAFVAAVGLAALNLIGGVLNFLGAAGARAHVALLALGLLLAEAALPRLRPGRSWRPRTGWIAVGVAWIFGGAVAWAVVPTHVFNLHDDFHSYATRAVRLAQTGRLGNPFDSIGLDSLGSQSFFHGFFLAGDDIARLNGF